VSPHDQEVTHVSCNVRRMRTADAIVVCPDGIGYAGADTRQLARLSFGLLARRKFPTTRAGIKPDVFGTVRRAHDRLDVTARTHARVSVPVSQQLFCRRDYALGVRRLNPPGSIPIQPEPLQV